MMTTNYMPLKKLLTISEPQMEEIIVGADI